ncbi:sugar O-acetyltransferase [Corynebacterium breve]|uniref:Sugar O-acetyltransferase n=1 Tax=Corynebacterium breve TaxID=3049799 RepID=A0ABY8VFV8_9CORY|nr:sugar O-acetyltransferase [Corynebacterium breve]WIM67851.1 sugar O-acetyltransferase [Corynebacterium breve]
MHDMDRLRSGQWYLPDGEEPLRLKNKTAKKMHLFNQLSNTDKSSADKLLKEVLHPKSAAPKVWAPLHIEYGVNTKFGKGAFLNYNCVILDAAEVTVGARTLFSPGCQIITVEHPVHDLEMRQKEWERARPVVIGDDCWLGAGVMVMPGVTIGDRCVIGAGAVITKDIPSDSLVMGVPGAVVRKLNQGDAALEREGLDQEL